jgi:hypothetical protein
VMSAMTPTTLSTCQPSQRYNSITLAYRSRYC